MFKGFAAGFGWRTSGRVKSRHIGRLACRKHPPLNLLREPAHRPPGLQTRLKTPMGIAGEVLALNASGWARDLVYNRLDVVAPRRRGDIGAEDKTSWSAQKSVPMASSSIVNVQQLPRRAFQPLFFNTAVIRTAK